MPKNHGLLIKRLALILALVSLAALATFLAQPVPHRLGVYDQWVGHSRGDKVQWLIQKMEGEPGFRAAWHKGDGSPQDLILNLYYRGFEYEFWGEYPEIGNSIFPIIVTYELGKVCHKWRTGDLHLYLVTSDKSDECKRAAEQLFAKIHAKLLAEADVTYRPRCAEYAEKFSIVYKLRLADLRKWLRRKLAETYWSRESPA